MIRKPLLAALLAAPLCAPIGALAQTSIPALVANGNGSISNAGNGFAFSGTGSAGVNNCVTAPGIPTDVQLCGAVSVAIDYNTFSDIATLSTAQSSNGVRNFQGLNGFASGGATLTYYAEVYGPANGAPALIDFNASWNMVTTGTSSAIGSARLLGVNNLFGNLTFNGASYSGLDTQQTPYQPVGAGTQSAYANLNTLLTITLSLTANAGGFNATFPNGQPGTVVASFDPMITFDPSFNSTGYSLVFSPSPTPEPASDLLLLAGLGILGTIGMRRRIRG